MTLNQYQQEAGKTALPTAKNLIYATLKLACEAGKCEEVVGKAMRDNQWVPGTCFPTEAKSKLEKELGDVLWYVAHAAAMLNVTLESIAEKNLAKLHSRQQRGTLKGSGDER